MNRVYLITGGPSSDANKLIGYFRTALEATGKEHPSVAYVGTASGDSKSFYYFLRKLILAAGAGGVKMAPIIKNTDIDAAKQILSTADAVFLTGGEVEDGIVGLKQHGLDTFMTDLYHEGKLFFGISAGCIMMGQKWVHWDTEGDDDTARLFDCLGFVPFTFDAHGENEDWTELKCALKLLGDGSTGYGLADGGFYSADESGDFIEYDKPCVMLRQKG